MLSLIWTASNYKFYEQNETNFVPGNSTIYKYKYPLRMQHISGELNAHIHIIFSQDSI